VVIFSTTVSIGIFIGIMVRQSGQAESHDQLMAMGIANSFAAGSLLYISLAEMVSAYFSAPELCNKPMLRVYMVTSFALGCFAMTILAMWA
jgi:zinc transporter ZupT